MEIKVKRYKDIIDALEVVEKKIIDYDSTDDYELNKAIDNNVEVAEIMHKFTDEKKLISAYNNYDEINKHKKANVDKLISAVNKEKLEISIRRKTISLISSIVAAIAILSLFIYYTNIKDGNVVADNIETEIIVRNKVENIKSRVPTLILNSGIGVNLMEIKNLENNDDIKSISNNNIVYAKTTEQEVIKYNTLVIPSMYTYTVILSDSSEVIVSANSKLTYPVNFSGDYRDVELDGGAFFKVKKSDKPFRVKVKGIEVNVYGTEFNINSYNENTVKTILLSGSIGVKYREKGEMEEIEIKPNQEFYINTVSEITKLYSDVNIEKHRAWIDGFFRYDEEPICDLLEDLSNWYGVSFKYLLSEINDIDITAYMSRDMSIDDLLKMIEVISNVKFIKNGENYDVKK